MRCLAVLLFSLCLALPVLAADAAKPERKEVFGDLTVHYSAFNSSMLQPDVAAATGLVRSKNQGVLNIAVLKANKPSAAAVTGTVRDLIGRRDTLTFKQIKEQEAIYYIAQYPVRDQETLTFDLKVQAAGTTNSFSFNQEVFPDE
ncbi:DUF4426 domain-containing protein [Pseudomonas sp. R5(2019)]|uniref:DUF4426 domain-containing protein n=1 Tax=Pseudomonas sp. R5(2019) TaxID=2697566 RepID=UPI001411DF6B|nr:DUF4426 domain-containing protein [Pseudomonas sp. R5(2019)]NBA98665.1 DUF4426 domain-containing protein [Pseudomonas sp. R5(2019)]